MATEDRHFTHSTLRERIVEHVFVGDVLRTLGVSESPIWRFCDRNLMRTAMT